MDGCWGDTDGTMGCCKGQRKGRAVSRRLRDRTEGLEEAQRAGMCCGCRQRGDQQGTGER